MKSFKSILVPLMLGIFLLTACGKTNPRVNAKPETAVETNASPLEEEEQISEEKEATIKVEEKDVVIRSMYTNEDVNARLEGSTASDVKYVISKATEVGLLNQEKDWSKILYEGEVSFVATEYLSLDKPVERKLIVIDAGHQSKGNSALEPNGPGATKMKAKVSSGTSGVTTRVNEYELNLVVTLKLRKELEGRGYEVLLVRDRNDVNISNVDRAMFANNAKADCFIRIHANGSENSTTNGTLTICQTANNPYNASSYKKSYRLSDVILKGILDKTGSENKGIWQTDTMTGINWSKVPSTIVEMGFMSNPKEDVLLNTGEYQDRIVEGIANGVDSYFK